MELIGNLKDKVEKAKSKEEARGLIEGAGMKLSTDELEQIVGGGSVTYPTAQLCGTVTSGVNPNGYNTLAKEEWNLHVGDWSVRGQ